MCKDQDICSAVCRASKHFKQIGTETPIVMIGAPNTIMESTCAEMGIPFIQEYVCDFEYDKNGNCLIPRTHEALDLVAFRPRLMNTLKTGFVESKDGKDLVDLKLSSAKLSLCIHSDTPSAELIAATTKEVVDEFNRSI